MHPILGDRQRLVLHLFAWVLVASLLALLVRTVIGARWIESVLFALPMGLVAAPVSLSAWYLCRALPITRVGAARVAFTALAAATITAALWAAAGRFWWTTLERLDIALPRDAAAPLAALLVGLGALVYLLSVTVHYLLQASELSAAAERRVLESQIGHRDAELRALRAQVDPHFLFNSLNSISGLIAADPPRAREMCRRLADFLRDSLSLGAAPRILLGREIALAEQYLAIEQIRFGSRLSVQSHVSDDSRAVPVPPLIVQPLVENAVRHGIATCIAGGVIEIRAWRAGTRAVVSIVNPRDPDGGRTGTGLGLDIVRRRLHATFGDAASLAIEPAPTSYKVMMTLPAEEGGHDRR
jgi:signal transduction histidine kinase